MVWSALKCPQSIQVPNTSRKNTRERKIIKDEDFCEVECDFFIYLIKHALLPRDAPVININVEASVKDKDIVKLNLIFTSLIQHCVLP